MSAQSNILVAPLDWGLGHATRCIPVIRLLRQLGHRVVIAATGPSGEVLKQEFPDLEQVHLPGYPISYSHPAWMSLHLARQVPGFLRSIETEHRLTQRLVSEYGVDTIISDNRYGVWSGSCRNVIITHQLFLPVPRLARDWAKRFVFGKVSAFDQCWIPDEEGPVNLSGALSHGTDLPENMRYIGILSRFSARKTKPVTGSWLALASGPEPARSHFVRQLTDLFSRMKVRATIIGGQPHSGHHISRYGGVEVIPHLPSDALGDMIATHENLICRAGYSTLMDLAAMKRSAWIVPTPGQREQEYLARYLHARGLFRQLRESQLRSLNSLPGEPLPMLTEIPSVAWKDRITSCLSSL